MRFAILLALALALGGCGATPRGDSGARAPSAPATAPEPAGPPVVDEPLPRTPSGLADALATSTRSAETAVRAWLDAKPANSARPPEAVTLYSLHQQRIYRYLRRHPGLATRVIAVMPARLRRQARDNFAAGRSLVELAPKKPPKTQPPIHVGPAEPPQRLLAWYREAQARFGVRWQVLAAVNFVESAFGRLRNNSYAGAQGPMQFIPATWRAYGLGGNVRDPHDAILGAANYLRAAGAPASYRRAVYSYNPSNLYVDAILRYARQMQLRPERFYTYWSWQVFVRGRDGRDRRLTGPGL